MLILDTDILTIIQHKGGASYQQLRDVLDAANDDVVTTVISLEERVRGWLGRISSAKTVLQSIDAYDQLLRLFKDFHVFPVLPFDEVAAVEFTRLRRTYRRLGAMDLKIAAIVLANNATLLTRNRRDFEPIAGIRLLDLA